MKQYKYKIQWILDNIKELKKIINILGVKSLDSVLIRDYDYKIIDEYHGFNQHPYGTAESETIKYMKRALKKNPEVRYFEVLRR